MSKDNTVLFEGERLWNLGAAVHWLLPESKRPVEKGWTTGPRASWKHLKATYRPGYNVGVRLGTPSVIGDKYLAVIDVDVKSSEPHHEKEARIALRKFLRSVGAAELVLPEVLSGRGGGSKHLYCVTDKPFKTWNPVASNDEVKVKMPSKQVSQRETRELTEKEIKAGIRISRAWEISLYSDGRQVVVPPSIHPDTKREYTWGANRWQTEGDLPLIDFGVPAGTTEEKAARPSGENKPVEALEGFALADVALEWLPISDHIRAAIMTGQGVKDRSAHLIPATHALISAGLSRNEILTVLTEPKYFLGACAYDHAKTKNRMRAVHWLWRFTVRAVLEERSPLHAFAGVKISPGASVELTAAETEKQNVELLEGVYRPEDHGYYDKGKNGAKVPNYEALLSRFVEEHPYKMIADMKAIYLFNGTHYTDFSPFEVKAFAEEMFRPKPKETIRAEFLSKVMANHVTRRSFFIDTTEGKVNFKNGVLDLGSFGGLTPHSADVGFRGVLPYDFDKDARCPFFFKWLHGVMLGDRELIAILQEYMGYIIRGGEYRYHKALWLEGTGRNGKSTFIDVLKALIGAGNYSTISIKSLIGDKFAGADLDGKTANFSEETSPQELADSGPFKNLTGDGDLFVQRKFGDPYSFRNRAKLVMSYNIIPDLKDLSPGMLSRPLIVPFRKEIKEAEQDHRIKEKLFAELPGIFNFALRGWDRLERQNHFTKSGKSELALKKIREESCSAYQWVEDYVKFTDNPEERIDPRTMYEAYRATERYPYNKMLFFRRINSHPKMQKVRVKSNGERYYFGVQIR